MSGEPDAEISVVVPSHDRPLRLRWLLNALAEQTLPAERWELIVVHDSAGAETDALLAEHPLAKAGRLRAVRVAPEPPGAKRNTGWRLARAPLIAFTDDDCRPPEGWLAAALKAAQGAPANRIIQGATRPDPDELAVALHAPHAHSQSIDPPVLWAQTCNIIYPRALLERLGGFALPGAEDAELAQRALAAGAELIGAPQVLMYHAVTAHGLIGELRSLPRWEHLAGLAARHPQIRSMFTLRVFWQETHGWLLLALSALGMAARMEAAPASSRRRRAVRPALSLLAVPWALRAAPSYGSSPRGLLRAASELPGRAIVELTEIAVLARGSIRYRALVL